MSNENAQAGGELLAVRGLTKRYPGVVALNHVDFDVRRGEVHCLAGENGAGKSTLIEIIGGTIHADEGEIRFGGEPVTFSSPRNAQERGVAVLHQELPALPDLTVAENIFMSRLPQTRWGLVDYPALYRDASHWLEMIDADVSPRALLGELPVAKQQLVSIAKALSLEAQVIVFDEPSAVLTLVELERLFRIIRNLRDEGRGIVYISHRLEEIFEVGDRVTVLRNGELVATSDTGAIGQPDLIKQMVGRHVEEVRLRDPVQVGADAAVVSVDGVSRGGALKDVSLDIRRGEILGIFGLVGAGRTEIARAIVGADEIEGGTLNFGTTTATRLSPKQAMKHGVCLVPEDRKEQGLLLDKSVRENIALPALSFFSKLGMWLDAAGITKRAREFTERLRIATPSIEQRARYLSGGNQQKVVLGKWLGMDMDVLIFDEPTRGVDVGAKEEIRRLIVGLAEQGKAIMLISSEIPEILALSDRVVVMHSGRVTAELPVQEATQEKMLAYSMGSES